MRSDAKEVAVFIVALLALLAGIVGVVVWLEGVGCRASWGQSGMATKWSPIAGCLVEAAPGKWIPEKSYREVSE